MQLLFVLLMMFMIIYMVEYFWGRYKSTKDNNYVEEYVPTDLELERSFELHPTEEKYKTIIKRRDKSIEEKNIVIAAQKEIIEKQEQIIAVQKKDFEERERKYIHEKNSEIGKLNEKLHQLEIQSISVPVSVPVVENSYQPAQPSKYKLWRSCGKKSVFSNEGEAESAAEKFGLEYNCKFYGYECSYCGKWHLATDKNGKIEELED